MQSPCYDPIPFRRRVRMKRLILALLVIGLLLPGGCAPTSPIEQGEQEIEAGWIRIEIKDVGSIDYPP